jgi:hypothetical protein
MINIKELFEKFSNHVDSCKSAPFVCTTHAAFESWFRVELIPVLLELQYSYNSIETNYTYPNSRDKADLCVKDNQGNIVIELKSFVIGQDSNKKDNYPIQLKKLEKLTFDPTVIQVITFTTFIGYTESRMENYMQRFFTNPPWEVLGPSKLIIKYALYAAITNMNK